MVCQAELVEADLECTFHEISFDKPACPLGRLNMTSI